MENAKLSKPTDPVFTLNIASRLSETPAHSIRQYIDKGLLLPFVTKTGRHLFSEVDITRLKSIKNYLNDHGLNIAGIKAIYSLIPCWAIKKCSLSERNNCGAYSSIATPCWEASNKSFICLNTDCRECEIYRIPENSKDLKDIIKEVT
ncbi:MAG TPA: MerR family transcriptional regulator [Bacteroidales bacterium]|jgi:MerR family transcriptional regulator/heat shock protein HspR|nr:hypothetical protein [Bacteroidota bacterium]HJN04986.1 MerR family transcriptional regulator [Bacteroidales bacterium]|tara:strand:- start:230 stop:673 length:444 start_codon:yes stop_codon:yes gene_type:complete